MSEVSPRFYERINAGWPSGLTAPSGQEAIDGAKRLLRQFSSRPVPQKAKLTSGNRYTWVRRGILFVNPNATHPFNQSGWPGIVHDISHMVSFETSRKAHASKQARLELAMQQVVLEGRWHEGALKKPEPPKPPPRDMVRERYARIVKREVKWAAELERAKRLHAKAAREKRTYERRHGERLQ